MCQRHWLTISCSLSWTRWTLKLGYCAETNSTLWLALYLFQCVCVCVTCQNNKRSIDRTNIFVVVVIQQQAASLHAFHPLNRIQANKKINKSSSKQVKWNKRLTSSAVQVHVWKRKHTPLVRVGGSGWFRQSWRVFLPYYEWPKIETFSSRRSRNSQKVKSK